MLLLHSIVMVDRALLQIDIISLLQIHPTHFRGMFTSLHNIICMHVYRASL